jgi:hypothetical protein
MELNVKVIKVLEPLSGVSSRTGETWYKRSFVGEILPQSQYTKKVVLTVFGEDKWKQFNVVEGCEYQVSFDIDAREWNGKWFNDVSAWKVVSLSGGQPSPSSRSPQSSVDDAPF